MPFVSSVVLKHEAQNKLDDLEGNGSESDAEEKGALFGQQEIDDNGCHKAEHEDDVEHITNLTDALVALRWSVPTALALFLLKGFGDDLVYLVLTHLLVEGFFDFLEQLVLQVHGLDTETC